MSDYRVLYTVSELNNLVKGVLENIPQLDGIYVSGELSNYNVYASGHHYFTLKDSCGALKCVMFRSNAAKLRFRPQNGMKVCLFGNISVYTRDGVYQLVVSSISPLGAGELQIAFEQMRDKLQKEGLFDQRYKKELPRFPNKICVITSPDGAAVHDILKILKARWPLTKVIVLPVRVQGETAAKEIADAISFANQNSIADLIIAGRGGGSIEDLWAFNEEIVARAIFSSDIPVISAVGHEPDVTISDYVADKRASTPSNAAEIAVPDIEEFKQYLDSLYMRLNLAVDSLISQKHDALSASFTGGFIYRYDWYLRELKSKLEKSSSELLDSQTNNISRLMIKLKEYAAEIDSISPMKAFARGHAIAINQTGGIANSVNSIEPGDKIRLLLADGTLNCVVESIERGNIVYGK